MLEPINQMATLISNNLEQNGRSIQLRVFPTDIARAAFLKSFVTNGDTQTSFLSVKRQAPLSFSALSPIPRRKKRSQAIIGRDHTMNLIKEQCDEGTINPSSPDPEYQLNSFTLFPQLPPELRDMIYDATLALVPRIFEYTEKQAKSFYLTPALALVSREANQAVARKFGLRQMPESEAGHRSKHFSLCMNMEYDSILILGNGILDSIMSTIEHNPAHPFHLIQNFVVTKAYFRTFGLIFLMPEIRLMLPQLKEVAIIMEEKGPRDATLSQPASTYSLDWELARYPELEYFKTRVSFWKCYAMRELMNNPYKYAGLGPLEKWWRFPRITYMGLQTGSGCETHYLVKG